MHLFDEATHLDAVMKEDGAARFRGAAHPGFKNMVGPYGGWSAAMMAKAILSSGDPELRLVSLTTDFLAGVEEGAVELDARCDRSGRSTQFWSASLRAPGAPTVANQAMGILSRGRETVSWTQGERPDAPAPEDCPRPEIPLAWTETVEMRAAQNPPFAAVGDTRSSAWVRLSPDRPLDPVSLVAIADSPTPRVFYIIGQPDLIATVSMTVYLHASEADYAAVGADFVLIDATGARGGNGFFDQHARIWSRDGRLLASTQQIVNYRSKG